MTMSSSVPVISVVGPSNSGKTSLICALVSHLTHKGHSVAVAKHAPHGHNSESENVDSGRITSAGASRVSVVSPGKTSRFERRDVATEESITGLINWARDCDLLLLEGWKSESIPKILIGDSTGLEIAPPVIAEIEGGATYEEEELAELVEKIGAFMNDSKDKRPRITLRVDGEEIQLKRFPAAALAGVVTGYLETLDGVPSDWSALEIEIVPRS